MASELTRRTFLQSATLALGGTSILASLSRDSATASSSLSPLQEFGYSEVTLNSELHQQQLKHCHSILMGLDENSLLKPIRQMAGQPAPGEDLGGWYNYEPNYDYHTFDAGFAPAATFGQWVSALARMHAITGSEETRQKVLRLNRLYAQAISDGYYEKTRFPAYSYDKFVCGLIDSHLWAGDADAFSILQHTTDIALRHLPKKPIEHGKSWRPGTDKSYTWDESYTVPENLFLAYQRGAGDRYKDLGARYLLDEYYEPLAAGKNAFAGKHAYSHVNALCSAMQAYLTLGSEMHLRAAKNGFDMLAAQSFATGGWGPDELLRATGSNDLAESLTKTHASFETPCGSYAHFKLTRYLLRVTRDSRFGDSMEHVMYNTVLGAKPLQPDGSSFYYSDYNFEGRKVYSNHRWPCCSGTLPQVAADYRINTYFRDGDEVYVNLFIPSTLNWVHNGSRVTLVQTGSYPLDGMIEFELRFAQPTDLRINIRIPAWAQGAKLAVNGKQVTTPVLPGEFAPIRTNWKSGDRIQLEVPLKVRLESLDRRNSDTVAVLSGPLVLFPINAHLAKITRQQLLAATRVGAGTWRTSIGEQSVTLVPFTAIGDEPYSTYVNVAERV